jgi:predicted ATP-dependent endonuclease of OLD family
MRILFVEIQNFRKLKSVRLDFSEKITLCVGANNSGKTSAMLALGHFLVDPARFTTNDFTLSDWEALNRIGDGWASNTPREGDDSMSLRLWEPMLPTLDLWLDVGTQEVHYVRDILPSLDWDGSKLGVRLRFEPKNLKFLASEYLAAIRAAEDTKKAATNGSRDDRKYDVTLWPKDIRTFLDRKLKNSFAVRCYLLDPAKCSEPAHGTARAQKLPPGSEPIEGNPLGGLIRIDEISAQRGLGDATQNRPDQEQTDGQTSRNKKKLSEQLRNYYTRHLDPTEFPVPADLDALEAIEKAQLNYDERLAAGFSAALKELETLNYPGVTDPRIRIVTRLRPSDGMNHNAAVQYEVVPRRRSGGVDVPELTLPEEYNGLGYQNLISMVFKLMGFRDAWMRVGKAGKSHEAEGTERFLPPLQLVLVEEPEAYLHAQVQQVFLKKAYEVLRNHNDLREANNLTSQLVISTHSVHIAHECDFSWIRYFRRLPATTGTGVPTSAIINLSEVFGTENETQRFVTRYLRATHCDLFFADAAILVEGSAERMLIPAFIRRDFAKLHRCYTTLLEIGGSHARQLRPLIEHLGLITLIITDLDSVEGAARHKAVFPQRKCNQISRNSTITKWHPEKESLDELLDLKEKDKIKTYSDTPLFEIRVAYQTPMSVQMSNSNGEVEALARTFEDALVLENLQLFRDTPESGFVHEKIKEILNSEKDPANISARLFEILKSLNKAEFTLDLLRTKGFDGLKIPSYIITGNRIGWNPFQQPPI